MILENSTKKEMIPNNCREIIYKKLDIRKICRTNWVLGWLDSIFFYTK